jgi:hypothetical protein
VTPQVMRFTAYFWFMGWDCLQLGIHVCLSLPNIEIHIPFGFIRIGREPTYKPPQWRVARWSPKAIGVGLIA